MTRAWHEINWRKMLPILAVAIGIGGAVFFYFRLNPPAEVACVLVQNGQPVKAWGDACDAPGVEGVRLRASP